MTNEEHYRGIAHNIIQNCFGGSKIRTQNYFQENGHYTESDLKEIEPFLSQLIQIYVQSNFEYDEHLNIEKNLEEDFSLGERSCSLEDLKECESCQ